MAANISQIDSKLLNELVARIVKAVEPLRIVVFGSAARGRMGPHSDVDILVVMPEGSHRRRTMHEIYRRLAGIGISKDVVVVTENDVREYGNNPSLVIYPALREGKELYRA